jgi:triacylglycerol lipase
MRGGNSNEGEGARALVPIVLHHGVVSPGEVHVAGFRFAAFANLQSLFTTRGLTPIVTSVHPTASIEKRAVQLKRNIRERLKSLGHPRARVVIFAHSMGGLDARHMIAHLGMAGRVSALVTISTPHRGSPYADWLRRHLNRFRALQLISMLGLDVDAAHDLTTDFCARFNESTPDAPTVRYLSVSAARPFWEVSPLLYQPWHVIHAAEGDNDGMVSVRSSTWGEHLGVWPADHFHILNRRFVLEWRRRTGDIRPYYDRLLDRLERMGVLPRPTGMDRALQGT